MRQPLRKVGSVWRHFGSRQRLVLTSAHRCLCKRARARPCYSAHGHQAVLQSPWVTTCVCMREKRENGAELTGQKWPKWVGHDGGGDWIRSAHQPGTVNIQHIGSEYLKIFINTFAITYINTLSLICLLLNVNSSFLVLNTILTG